MTSSNRTPRPPCAADAATSGRGASLRGPGRVTDPAIPPTVRDELELALRRAFERRARAFWDGSPEDVRRAMIAVHDSLLALGRRGRPWWEPASPADRRVRFDGALRVFGLDREFRRVVDDTGTARGRPTVREFARRDPSPRHDRRVQRFDRLRGRG